MPSVDKVSTYGLIRPGMGDALVAVHRAHGPNAAHIWAQLLTAADLVGDETDDTALYRMIDAMTADPDPLLRVSARSLRVRLSSYTLLAAQQGQTAHTDARSRTR